MGISYPPTWMDWPMIWKDHPDVIEQGMVFFMHMILMDSAAGQAMTLGETVIVGDGAHERLSSAKLEMAIR